MNSYLAQWMRDAINVAVMIWIPAYWVMLQLRRENECFNLISHPGCPSKAHPNELLRPGYAQACLRSVMWNIGCDPIGLDCRPCVPLSLINNVPGGDRLLHVLSSVSIMLEIVSEAVWACEQFISDNFIFRQNRVETGPILQALVYYAMLSFLLGGMSLHWLNVVPQATVIKWQ